MSDRTANRVEVLEDPEQIAVLAHPTRVAVLDALREPASSSGVARALGLKRQVVNYHVKALLDVGLIRLTGERRTGNFIEQLYESVAGTFVVSPRFAWSDDRRITALASQLPLEHLVAVGERVQRDAIELLDRAAFDNEEIPCAAVEASVRLKDEEARAAFLSEYLEAVQALLKKYGGRKGDPFCVAIAVYPSTGEGQ